MALAALALALAGCAEPEEEPMTPSSTEGGPPPWSVQDVPRPDVDLTADVEATPEAVTVSWTLTNTGDAPLLVVDRPPRASGATVVYDPAVSYVVGGGDDRVEIGTRLLDVPETDRMTWARLPRVGATGLAPGDTLRRTLRVPVPLQRLSPWGDDVGYGPIELPDPVGSVQLCLGILPDAPEPSWGPGREGDVVVLEHGSPAVAAQYVLCADPVAMP